jgi:hypothetical protein
LKLLLDACSATNKTIAKTMASKIFAFAAIATNTVDERMNIVFTFDGMWFVMENYSIC